MIERMLEQKVAINRVLEEDRKAEVKIDWQTADVLTAMNKALQPVSEFTDAMSSEKNVTASALLPLLQLIEEDTLAPDDDDTSLTQAYKAGIIKILHEKYDVPRSLPEKSLVLLRKATFLDPRYRGDCDDDVEATKVTIKDEAVILKQREVVVREEGEEREEAAAAAEQQPKRKKTLGSLFKRRGGAAVVPATIPEKAASEMNRYCQEPLQDLEEDPLDWWKENQQSYPLLATVAKKYLCICATSCASERLFSTAGNIVTPARSLLEPEKVNQLVFLAKNM